MNIISWLLIGFVIIAVVESIRSGLRRVCEEIRYQTEILGLYAKRLEQVLKNET